MAQKKTTASILESAHQTLEAAQYGLDDFLNAKGSIRLVGYRNLVTFGRSVTLVLQNLKSTAEGFEEWYEPYVAEMKDDPMMRHFVELRNKVLKEGDTGLGGHSIYIEYLDVGEAMRLAAAPPKIGESLNFFIGDRFGGSGWLVTFADGSQETYYVDLPKSMVDSSMLFRDQPTHHAGGSLDGVSAEEQCKLYIAYLERMVAAAESRFGVVKV